jgi:hypothetical protein
MFVAVYGLFLPPLLPETPVLIAILRVQVAENPVVYEVSFVRWGGIAGTGRGNGCGKKLVKAISMEYDGKI